MPQTENEKLYKSLQNIDCGRFKTLIDNYLHGADLTNGEIEIIVRATEAFILSGINNINLVFNWMNNGIDEQEENIIKTRMPNISIQIHNEKIKLEFDIDGDNVPNYFATFDTPTKTLEKSWER